MVKNMQINLTSCKNEPQSSSFINKEEIETLIQFLSVSPESVSVWLKKDKEGGLLLNVKITVKRKSTIQKEMQIPADDDLVSSVIYAMSGDIEPLEKYKESEHKPKEYVDADKFKQEIFEALLETHCPLTLRDELENCKGEHYVTASFRIAYKKNVNICLKKTQEVVDKIKLLIAKEDIAKEDIA
ncbi:hypothetical protein IKN40_04770 [bacterium]|nr:hypothetical protein [bacterium]